MKNPLMIVLIAFMLSGCAYNAQKEQQSVEDSIRFEYERQVDSIGAPIVIPDDADQTAGPDSSLSEELERFMAGRLEGYVDYNFRQQMRVGRAEVVSVVISRRYPAEKLAREIESFRDQDSIKRSVVKIAPMVVVVLQEATTGTFEIKPRFISPQQPIHLNDTSYTEFSWDVTPLKAGEYKLTFHVNLLIETSATPVYTKSFDGVIRVQSDQSLPGRILAWIELHWTIVAYVVSGIFAILGWLYKEKIIRLFGAGKNKKSPPKRGG